MKRAADFRKIARDALTGNWGIALLAGLLASIFNTSSSAMSRFSSNVNDAQTQIPMDSILENEQASKVFFTVLFCVSLFALAIAIAFSILASVVRVGYCKFNLEFVDWCTPPSIGTLFRYFKHWKTTAAAVYLRALYIFLWSLLFFIPGYIATYSYAMTEYILAEYPTLSASEALKMSKTMMRGNRWRLFCLRMSFLGWELLAILTLGVGYLWLLPYIETAQAAFFREIAGNHYIRNVSSNP